ncbi:MAG TPA: flavin reductase family protein [Candidatus Latescibacteria bacterium]|nr:flavin reductase family protein [Candidatus Latescibacterota bacterium]
MSKVEVGYTDYLKETLDGLEDGLLLTSVDKKGEPNVMTIGWGSIGRIWGKPMFVVLVRPSRFTYGLIEETGEFTVNVPPKELAEAVAFCGSVSGRDHDKFKEKGLTPLPGRLVKSPLIEECVLHYECKVVHKNDVIPGELAPDIIPEFYPKDDYHRVYFGEIISVYASRDIKALA